MVRVFLVHRWDGVPEADWYPWLKKQLQEQGHELTVLQLPDPAHPSPTTWVPPLEQAIGAVTTDAFLIGHSIGVQTILRYLQTASGPVGGCVFVAGWTTLKPEATQTEDEKEIVKPWLVPLKPAAIKKRIGQCVVFFSDNDPYVPLEENKIFFQKLGKIIVEQGRGHYTEFDGVREVPQVLKEVMAMLPKKS